MIKAFSFGVLLLSSLSGCKHLRIGKPSVSDTSTKAWASHQPLPPPMSVQSDLGPDFGLNSGENMRRDTWRQAPPPGN